MSENLEARLRAAFIHALELGDDVDVESLKYRDIPAWDSLGHMGLVATIEVRFQVHLDTDQVIGLNSFEAGLKILADLGVQ